MSQQLISRSPDLKRLLDEGYDIEIRSGHLLVKSVPYVDSSKTIVFGTLVCPLDVSGDVTQRPSSHQAYFAGNHPCRSDGTKITAFEHGSGRQALAKNVLIDHSFSAMPKEEGGYRDFYHKITHYASVISNPARELDPTIKAQGCDVIVPSEEISVFCYLDSATSRAGIGAIAAKLEHKKIAVVGVGGTGSYILDFVAKTPVAEIHLFDGDMFQNHNAFRTPGAPSIDELREKPSKVNYLQKLYSKMHRKIISHEIFLDEESIANLRSMDFVFLCLDRGSIKPILSQCMEEWDIPFIDVGMGLDTVDGFLRGIVRVTLSSPKKRDHYKKRVSMADAIADNVYSKNIQIAELNALNASLAIIKWKKYCGVYQDLEHEHCSAYTINGNTIANEDQA